MSRIDKYDPISGGFRAALAFAPVADDIGKVIPVDVNGAGRVIKSVDGTASEGVLCMDELLAIGDAVDVMTDGEIVDVNVNGVTTDVTGAAAGVAITAGAGVVSNVALGKKVGRMIEAWRLVVRFERS